MSRQYSARAYGEETRQSVQGIIQDLEDGMSRRGGNYMGITGMNLRIVATLLNHIDRLEDRIDYLEGLLLPSSRSESRGGSNGNE